MVSWLPPHKPNGIIRKYTIYCSSPGSGQPVSHRGGQGEVREMGRLEPSRREGGASGVHRHSKMKRREGGGSHLNICSTHVCVFVYARLCVWVVIWCSLSKKCIALCVCVRVRVRENDVSLYRSACSCKLTLRPHLHICVSSRCQDNLICSSSGAENKPTNSKHTHTHTCTENPITPLSVSIYLCFYISICISIYLILCLSITLSINLSLYLSISINLSFSLYRDNYYVNECDLREGGRGE